MENDVPRGQGWEKTVTKVSAWEHGTTDHEEFLTEALRQHTISGEKALSIYRVGQRSLAALRDQARALAVPPSAAAQRYPCLLEEEELAEEEADLKLIAVEEDENGIALVFSSVRFTTIRDILTPEQINEDNQEVEEMFSRYDEIIGVKHRRTQALDVLWLPNRGEFLDLRIDHPPGMNGVQAQYALGSLELFVSELLDATIENPLNLFNLIQNMYNNSHEGIVVELAFGTTTASSKHERMRRAGLEHFPIMSHRIQRRRSRLDTRRVRTGR